MARGRIRASSIWKCDKEVFASIVRNSETLGDVLDSFPDVSKGANYKTVIHRLNEDGLDYQHLIQGANKRRSDRLLSYNSVSCKLILDENSSSSRKSIKQKIIKDNLIPYKCSECDIVNTWKNKEITLVLDHINGIYNDHRIENLRFLCPNCNSQTNTFAGRNVKLRREKGEKPINSLNSEYRFTSKIDYYCICGVVVSEEGRKCVSCHGLSTRRCERPTKEELADLLWKIPTTKIAIQFGVSDKAVSKWAISYGLEKPPRGYWAKIHK